MEYKGLLAYLSSIGVLALIFAITNGVVIATTTV